MTVTATVKGQIVIPASLRQKLKIRQGTRLHLEEREGKLILQPLSDEFVSGLLGKYASASGSLVDALLEDRAREREA